jgi:outer membrane protein assembly factor BamB
LRAESGNAESGRIARRAGVSALCGAAVFAIAAAIPPAAQPAQAGASAAAGTGAGTAPQPGSGSAAQQRAGAAAKPGVARPRLSRVVSRQDWPAYLFTARHRSAATGPAAIKPANAGHLTAAWTFHERPPTGDQPPGGFSASPVVAAGRVFIGSQSGEFYALRESTGRVLWRRALDHESPGNNGDCKNARGIVGTATVGADPRTGRATVYVPGARYLYALDAATGALRWKSLVGAPGSAGVVGAYYNYASPTVTSGLVYEGVSSSCNEPFVRGGVQAFSQRTGGLVHSFWTVPAGAVGASVWSSVAATADSVWVTTGDPRYHGKHPFHAYSFLRLDAHTMALHGSWRLSLPQAADLDFGSSPTLFYGTVQGTPAGLVGACNKDGVYYALRRDALARGPVWSVRVGVAAHNQKGMCLASAVWNAPADQLYLAGNATRINGTLFYGSVREVNPGTGATRWIHGLGCSVLGTPALDVATGLLAVATWSPCLNGSPAVYLISAATGRVRGRLPLAGGAFAQPVFAGRYLLVTDVSGQVTAYRPATAAAQATGQVPCRGWCGLSGGRPPSPPVPAP